MWGNQGDETNEQREGEREDTTIYDEEERERERERERRDNDI